MMLENGKSFKKICVVGCGNMGGALIRGLSICKIRDSIQLIGIDKNIEKLNALPLDIRETDLTNFSSFVDSETLVILAVKPKVTIETLRKILTLKQTGYSLASFSALNSSVEIRSVIGADLEFSRIMSNLPIGIGSGSSAVYSDSDQASNKVCEILSYVGKVVKVSSEEQFNLFTAMVGCGPGFIAEIIRSLIVAFERAGYDKSQVDSTVFALLEGSFKDMQSKRCDPASYISSVATPGGVTEAEVLRLRSEKLEDVFFNALNDGINKLNIK